MIFSPGSYDDITFVNQVENVIATRGEMDEVGIEYENDIEIGGYTYLLSDLDYDLPGKNLFKELDEENYKRF